MTILQTTQHYAPSITLEYDEAKELYLGRVLSRTGVFEMEGPDKNSVMYQIEDALYWEHAQLLRDLELEKGIDIGPSKGVEVSSGADIDKSASIERSRTPTRVRSAALSTAVSSALSYAFPQLGIVQTLGEFCSGLLGLLTRKKVYVVFFCGIKISARSKKKLKKKIIMHRNRRISRIMNGIKLQASKQHQLTVEKRASLATKRLKIKKKMAVAKSPDKWKHRVKKIDKKAMLEERVDSLRLRVLDKKQNARDLWTGRL